MDYGTFLPLAETLSQTYKRVLYHSPFEQEYRNVHDCIIGTGIEGIERCDEYLEPSLVSDIDLLIVPDIGYSSLQQYFKSIGKAVWGSMGASDLELYRTRFISLLDELKLPSVPSVKLTGISSLRSHLKEVQDKWIKINRFRDNMETWQHHDYAQSKPYLDELESDLAGVSEYVVFIVQDNLPDAIEVGYDGFSVDGEYPGQSFQGYEKKNELYIGALLKAGNLPEEILSINHALSPVLREYSYRNFIATEIRIVDGTPYFIDPTMRLAGQTMEHQLESCTNLADLIWHGANGNLIEPVFTHHFAAEATLHYTGACTESRCLVIPESVRKWVKCYGYYVVDDATWFTPRKNDEIGVVLGLGDSVEDAIQHLHDNLDLLKDCPVSAHTEGFIELAEQINDAEAEGITFSEQKPPKPTADLVS